MIQVSELSKTYKRQIRQKGFANNLASLFVRKYEDIPAVKNISFSIAEGEIVGFIGPNGAGKSTTIKMLSSILTPTSGCVTVDGIDPAKHRKENAMKIGVVFGQRSQLWWDIPVIESYKLLKYMYKVEDKRFEANLGLFKELLGLGDFLNAPVRQLSLGQKMRAELAAALLHDPRILYLDEPTIGLDVLVKEKIRQFIGDINAEKKVTIVLTTHDIGDIEKLCKRVIVIDKGGLVFDDDLKLLERLYVCEESIILELEDPSVGPEDLRTLFPDMDFKKRDSEIVITYRNDRYKAAQIMQELFGRYRVKDFTVKKAEIESIIRNVYAGTAAETI